MAKIIIISKDVVLARLLQSEIDKDFGESKIFLKVNYSYLEHNKIDVIFYYARMGDANSADITTWLGKNNRKVLIVFVSNHINRVSSTTLIKDFYEIDKSDLRNQLKNMTLLLKSRGFAKGKKVMFKKLIIDLDDFIYARVESHYIKFKMCDEEFKMRATLSELEQALSNHLCVRTNRNVLLNLKSVCHKQTYCSYVLKNGEELQVGRKYYADFKQAIQEARVNSLI